MKFLGKLVLWLLIALLVVIVAAYFAAANPLGGAPGEQLVKRKHRLENRLR